MKLEATTKDAHGASAAAADGSSNAAPPSSNIGISSNANSLNHGGGGAVRLIWTHNHYRDYPLPSLIPADFCARDAPFMLAVQVPNAGFNESFPLRHVFCSSESA